MGRQNHTEPGRNLLARFCGAGVAFTATMGACAWGIACLKRIRPRCRRTMFGTAWTYETRTDQGEQLRMLVVDGACQGASYHGEKWNTLPFEYLRAFDRMFAMGKHIERVLLIGGGGFAYPKHLLTRRPDVSMDVLEPDAKVIGIALKEFHLNRLLDECPDRIRIIQSTGQKWLEGSDDCYDAIVNDAFTGFDPVRDMVDAAFLEKAKSHLSPGGLYLANVVTYPKLGDYSHLEYAVEALKGIFASVQAIPTSDEAFSDEENYLVIASDSALPFEDAI